MDKEHIYRTFDYQLAQAICDGKREVTMDDATDDGRLAADPSGLANAGQNALGGYLPSRAKRGLVVRTDRSARARSPRRRGGSLSVWYVTDDGVAWAEWLMRTQVAL
jgi:hypothetical protein